VPDRFHVKKLAFDALLELKIKYRWKATNHDNQATKEAKANNVVFKPEILPGGDAPKQLLATSRYLVFKRHRK